jgi:para-nitrobenzyl esterase
MTEITTRLGRVKGTRRRGVDAFLGLRYAEAPTGARRFAPPTPSQGWDGVYDATQPGARAPQLPGPDIAGRPDELRHDEDCLFLNIYTPGADDRARPVLFWIHGGGYEMGSANDYDGTNLVVQGDVVVVCINYRLGLLGFADLSRLGSDLAGSASNGLSDQIEALRWVHDNIADYGGDPGNVTIFGESAGGGSVVSLLAAPSADGLYHRAIAHSPGGGSATPAFDAVALLSAAAGVSEDSLLERLRAMSVDEILALQAMGSVPTTAVVDGVVVTRAFPQAIRERGSSGVAVIAGSTRDEGTLLSEIVPADAHESASVGMAGAVMQGQDPSAYLEALRATYPDADVHLLHTLVWTDLFRRTSIHAAEAATSAGPGGWLYRFDLPTTELGGRLGATHGSDVAFIFNTVAEGPAPYLFRDPDDPATQKLAELWSNTIIAFARTGNPNGAGLPEWPKYSSDDRRCLVLDADSRVEGDLDTVHRRLWGDD